MANDVLSAIGALAKRVEALEERIESTGTAIVAGGEQVVRGQTANTNAILNLSNEFRLLREAVEASGAADEDGNPFRDILAALERIEANQRVMMERGAGDEPAPDGVNGWEVRG